MFNLIKNYESTNKKCNRPFSEWNGGLYAKDEVCLDYDFETGTWDLMVNADIFSGIGWQPLEEALNTLSDESRKRRRKAEDKERSRVVIFVSKLNIMSAILIDKLNITDDMVSKYETEKRKNIMEITTAQFQFRNFDLIMNDHLSSYKRKYKDRKGVEIMRGELRTFGYIFPKVRYSGAYMGEKMFFKPIYNQCRTDRGLFYFDSIKTYQCTSIGGKAGFFKHFDKDSEIAWKIQRNITSYDKKSAYQSAFLTDPMFPQGKTHLVNTDLVKKIIKAYDKQLWFKICIEPDAPFTGLLSEFQTKHKLSYGVEYYDFDIFIRTGLDQQLLEWINNNESKCCVLLSEKTDYMPIAFRERGFEVFQWKESIKDREDPDRIRLKFMLECLYGKGIQKHDFRTLQEVNDYYDKRNAKLIMPHQSMHAAATVRRELFTLVMSDKDIISYDTDGVKTKSHNDIWIQAANKNIREINKKAGFEGSNIGMWCEEWYASRFLQFATKVYAYDTSFKKPDITWKLAGVPPQSIDKFLQDIGDKDPLDYIIQNGYDFITPAEYLYDPSKGAYTPTQTIYQLRQTVNLEQSCLA